MVGYRQGNDVGTERCAVLNIAEYLDKIMEVANLTRKDGRRVRSELENHIQELLTAGENKGLSESEVAEMIEKEFGDAEELGTMIAKAKGRFLTYMKKQTKKTAIGLTVALVVAFTIKTVAFEAFYVSSDVASPRVPASSRVLVNKFTEDFEVDDVLVFRIEQGERVGIVKKIDDANNGLVVARKGEEDMFVSNDAIVGKAVFLYFCKL